MYAKPHFSRGRRGTFKTGFLNRAPPLKTVEEYASNPFSVGHFAAWLSGGEREEDALKCILSSLLQTAAGGEGFAPILSRKEGE